MSEQVKEQPEVKFTKVPFTIEEMKEYFVNKNKFFIINYKESELKGNRFLSYVGNLDIPFEIDYTGASKEERFELVSEFLKSRNLVKLSSLALSVAEILIHSRGIKAAPLTNNGLFNDEQKDEVIKLNQEVIDHWNTFLLSTNIFMLTTVKPINDEYKFNNAFPEIVNATYLGQNVVQLFSVPRFMETYMSAPIDREIFYFKHQFEDYIYRGKNLFHYFRTPENTPYALFETLMDGSTTMEELDFLKSQNP